MASSLVWGLGTVGAIAMAGAIVASPGITVGMAASMATPDGVTVNSMVTGIVTVIVVNGTSVVEAGIAKAAAGTMAVVAGDMTVMTIAADIATNETSVRAANAALFASSRVNVRSGRA